MTVKEALLEIAQNLPEGCTWDEVLYRIYVRQKMDETHESREDWDVYHEEVFREYYG